MKMNQETRMPRGMFRTKLLRRISRQRRKMRLMMMMVSLWTTMKLMS
jgi:hypothetical protein